MAAYEKRFVAFVDILGFKALIERTAGDRADVRVDDIRDILIPPPPAGPDQIVLGRIGDISHCAHRLTSFSDSIAISTTADECGLIHLLFHLEKISYRLFELGVLCRGALTQGLIYHDESVIFGPALVRAVEQEKPARYPRIILDGDVVDYGRACAAPVGTIFNRLVRESDDGLVMVHALRRVRIMADMESDPPPAWHALVQGRRAFLATELERLKDDQRSREKVEWFSCYFEWACDRSAWEILKQPLPTRRIRDLFDHETNP